LHTF